MSKEFTGDEISKLNGRDNVHVVIHGKVYDVVKFLDEHPGGDEVLLGEGGKDATEAFEDVGHSDEARELMTKFEVGTCKDAIDHKEKMTTKTRIGAKKADASGFNYLMPLAALIIYIAYRIYSKQS